MLCVMMYYNALYTGIEITPNSFQEARIRRPLLLDIESNGHLTLLDFHREGDFIDRRNPLL
jgi:hypothetical protein